MNASISHFILPATNKALGMYCSFPNFQFLGFVFLHFFYNCGFVVFSTLLTYSYLSNFFFSNVNFMKPKVQKIHNSPPKNQSLTVLNYSVVQLPIQKLTYERIKNPSQPHKFNLNTFLEKLAKRFRENHHAMSHHQG